MKSDSLPEVWNDKLSAMHSAVVHLASTAGWRKQKQPVRR